jgi:hypothetical protein
MESLLDSTGYYISDGDPCLRRFGSGDVAPADIAPKRQGQPCGGSRGRHPGHRSENGGYRSVVKTNA